jgi:TDG/mug DNA glycosylase family protein
MRKHAFPPVADGRTRLLVLGSLPGEASLAAGRYYAYPRNQFWRLMAAATRQPLMEADYEARLAMLADAGVGLWDVVHSAERSGSLDAAIRDHRVNALADLAGRLPRLRAIAFNGGKAAAIGRRQPGIDNYALIDLPSSSPAHVRPVEDKLVAWRALSRWLDDD